MKKQTTDQPQPIELSFDEWTYYNRIQKLEQIAADAERISKLIPEYIKESFNEIVSKNNLHELVESFADVSINLPIGINEKVKLICPDLFNIKLQINLLIGSMRDCNVTINILNEQLVLKSEVYNEIRLQNSIYANTADEVELVKLLNRIKTDIHTVNTKLSAKDKMPLYSHNQFTPTYMKYGVDLEFQFQNII